MYSNFHIKYIFKTSSNSCEQQVFELKLCQKLDESLGKDVYSYQQQFNWYIQSSSSGDGRDDKREKLSDFQKLPQLLYVPSRIEDMLEELKKIFNNFISFERRPVLKKESKTSYFEDLQWQQQQKQQEQQQKQQKQEYEEVISASDMRKYVSERKQYNISKRAFGWSYMIIDDEDEDDVRIKAYLRKSDLSECKLIHQALLKGQFTKSVKDLIKQNRKGKFKTVAPNRLVKFTTSIIQHHESIVRSAVAFFKYYDQQLFALSIKALYCDLYEQDFNLQSCQATVLLSLEVFI